MRCRLTFLSSVVAIALSAGIPLNNIDPGVLPDGRDAEFACGSAKDHTQFAYVMMHYEGTPKDPEYVLGTRVLIKSLQASGTKEDLVILASNSVSAATIRTFCADGAIVQLVDDIPNPFKDTVKPRFLNALNKLHLWKMTRYQRVVYLDADNIVTNNMDELFQAGRFCVVYMNACHFHTGLMVIKPDVAEYDRLMGILMNGGHSYDGADQGFLDGVYGPELMNAPLFVGNRSTAAGPDDLMRLPIGYNMHHLYKYETMNFDMFRVQRFRQMDPPYTSMAYPIAPAMKPWNWLPYAFLDVHFDFLRYRLELQESFFVTVTLRLAVVPIGYVICIAIATVLAQTRQSAHVISEATILVTKRVGVPMFSWISAYISVACIIYVAFSIVPQILPPLYGWGLFLSYITAGIYTLLRIIGMIAEVTSPSLPSATPQLSTATAVGKQMVMPVVIQLLCCIVVFTDVKLLFVKNLVDRLLCPFGAFAGVYFILARCVKGSLQRTLQTALAIPSGQREP